MVAKEAALNAEQKARERALKLNLNLEEEEASLKAKELAHQVATKADGEVREKAKEEACLTADVDEAKHQAEGTCLKTADISDSLAEEVRLNAEKVQRLKANEEPQFKADDLRRAKGE